MRTMNDRQLGDRSNSLCPRPTNSVNLLRRVAAGELDNTRARDVFAHLLEHDGTVDDAIERLGDRVGRQQRDRIAVPRTAWRPTHKWSRTFAAARSKQSDR